MYKPKKISQFSAHLLAFSLMAGASLGLILTIQNPDSAWTWPLLALFAIANLLAIANK